MANIVFITSGLTGILYASFEMVKRLEAAGHKVTYASPKEVGPKVEINNIAYKQLPPINFFPCPELPKFKGPYRKIRRQLYKITNSRKLQKGAVEELGMDKFKTFLEKQQPDIVIIDVELHEHLMTCFTSGIKMLLISQWFSLWNRPGLPPLLHDTIPGQGFSGSKLGLKLAWTKVKLQRWWTFSKLRWRSMGTDRRSVLKRYADRVGFPLAYAKENYWPGPFTYNTLPVLSMTTQEMEFSYPKQPELSYIGAMVFANRKSNLEPKALEAFQQIFDKKRTENRSLIYCSVSSFKQGDTNFLKKIVQAVAEKPEWLLIISLGGLLEQNFLKVIPENIFPFSWVPQLRVLEQADCSINHGGIHTINECIHFKVPMVVYSGKRSDQNGCAARVAYHGLGIMADKDSDSVKDIQLNIEKVLTTDSYKTQVNKMHGYYMQYKADQKLEKIVEDQLQMA